MKAGIRLITDIEQRRIQAKGHREDGYNASVVISDSGVELEPYPEQEGDSKHMRQDDKDDPLHRIISMEYLSALSVSAEPKMSAIFSRHI
jgi:hypothetical protein